MIEAISALEYFKERVDRSKSRNFWIAYYNMGTWKDYAKVTAQFDNKVEVAEREVRP